MDLEVISFLGPLHCPVYLYSTASISRSFSVAQYQKLTHFHNVRSLRSLSRSLIIICIPIDEEGSSGRKAWWEKLEHTCPSPLLAKPLPGGQCPRACWWAAGVGG